MQVKRLLNPPSEDCNDPGEILKYNSYLSVLNNMEEHEVMNLLVDEVLHLRKNIEVLEQRIIKLENNSVVRECNEKKLRYV